VRLKTTLMPCAGSSSYAFPTAGPFKRCYSTRHHARKSPKHAFERGAFLLDTSETQARALRSARLSAVQKMDRVGVSYPARPIFRVARVAGSYASLRAVIDLSSWPPAHSPLLEVVSSLQRGAAAVHRPGSSHTAAPIKRRFGTRVDWRVANQQPTVTDHEARELWTIHPSEKLGRVIFPCPAVHRPRASAISSRGLVARMHSDVLNAAAKRKMTAVGRNEGWRRPLTGSSPAQIGLRSCRQRKPRSNTSPMTPPRPAGKPAMPAVSATGMLAKAAARITPRWRARHAQYVNPLFFADCWPWVIEHAKPQPPLVSTRRSERGDPETVISQSADVMYSSPSNAEQCSHRVAVGLGYVLVQRPVRTRNHALASAAPAQRQKAEQREPPCPASSLGPPHVRAARRRGSSTVETPVDGRHDALLSPLGFTQPAGPQGGAETGWPPRLTTASLAHPNTRI